MIDVTINDNALTINAVPGTPLLWILRDDLNLYGTKFGCGKGLCGACTVHINGNAVRSCQVTIDTLPEKSRITTIEGLGNNSDHPIQTAWMEMNVPQCGYCQAGQIMAASALLNRNSKPSDKDINDAMSGNLCRCATYPKIRAAIHRASTIATKNESEV